MKHIFTLLLCLSFSISSFAQTDFFDSDRFRLNADLAPFYHGVASGDPMPNSVIIWTRVTTDDLDANVHWQVATDTAMTNIVADGWVTTDAESDFTVKVDVQGLQPYTTYYYEFSYDNAYSLRGRTRTAPEGNSVDSLRFAVVSCSNFAYGFFHVYDKIVDRNDVDAVIHLGDYIYEYGDGEYGDVRELEPGTEILTLADYRMRHSYYKLDPQLMRLHQQYPIITTWDDHESANDAWYGGAENHNTGEGDWFDRKSYAITSYHEWMPLRKPDNNDTERIYRKFSYGDLMDLFILDTRLHGRQEQGVNENDANRTILGSTQYNWLTTEMSNSTAKWQVLGQQVMVAPLEIFGQPVNGDQWDGYDPERVKLYNYVIDNNVPNMVVLTGDIHTSWANDLPMSGYNSGTGANSAGVEFVTTSVTSPGLPIPAGEALIMSLNDHIKDVNLADRGFYILDVNQDRCQADYYTIGSVTDATTSVSHDASWQTLDGSRHLSSASNQAPASTSHNTTYAPDDPRNYQSVPTQDLNEVAFIGIHPNPITDKIYLQFYNHETVDMTLHIYDVSGKELYHTDLGTRVQGLQNKTVDVSTLTAGTYYVTLKTPKGLYNKMIIKL